jgi:enoyl-CoA hydratase/carnithine racemase
VGLVNVVCQDEALLPTVCQAAAKLAHFPPVAMGRSKALINSNFRTQVCARGATGRTPPRRSLASSPGVRRASAAERTLYEEQGSASRFVVVHVRS